MRTTHTACRSTILTSRERYQREAFAYFKTQYPEVEIGSVGTALLSMPTPPRSPSPGESVSPQNSLDSQSGLPESGAIDLTEGPEKTATSPSPQAAAKKQRVGGGRQGTLNAFARSAQNHVRPASDSADRGSSAQPAAAAQPAGTKVCFHP